MTTPVMINERLLVPIKSKWVFTSIFFEIGEVNVRFNNLSLLMKYS